MSISRRNLNLNLLSLAIVSALAAPRAAFAQGKAYAEGIDYRQLKPRQAVTAEPKKIEVIEFFWFGCPHCNSLDPALLAWLKKAPADVVFKRVHITFDAENAPVKRTETHQKLYYALETLGMVDKLAPAVFTAIHGDKKSLMTRDSVMEWAGAQKGLDLPKFTATFDDGFNMSRKMRSATQLQEAYKVDGVPYFAIDGQYITSPSISGGSNENFFMVMNHLIDKVRKDRAPAKPEKSTNKLDSKSKKEEVKKI